MTTINQPNFQAVFVNTNQHPKKVIKHPFFKVIALDDGRKVVNQLQTWEYWHPDSEEQATVSILGWREVNVAKESIAAFESIQNGMAGLSGLII